MSILFSFLFACVVTPYYSTACFWRSRSEPYVYPHNLGINEVPFAETNSSDLNFTAGDIITCNNNNNGSHIFLASSNSNVMCVEGDTEKMRFKTRVAIKAFKDVTRVYNKCDVVTEFYDQRFAADCKGHPFETEQILRRARFSNSKFNGRYIYFDNWRCNSEHWVTAWRYGTSWTLQTPELHANKFRGDDCEAPGLQKCKNSPTNLYECKFVFVVISNKMQND